jgi:hypothetical protein
MKRVFNPWVDVVPAIGKDILTAFERISLPALADVAHPAFRRLTTAGSDGQFVLQTTWMYAMLQKLFEEERRRLAGLPRDCEATQLRGLRITLKQGKKHVSDCRRIADDIQTLLVAARVPGGSLRDNVDVITFFLTLPDVLRKYAALAEDLAERTRPTKEAVAQRNRVLLYLVNHVTGTTGHPFFSELADVILGWREIWPFSNDVSADVLRKQFRRAASFAGPLRDRSTLKDEVVPMNRVNRGLNLVPATSRGISYAFEDLSLPAAEQFANAAIRRLTSAGCNDKFVLQTTLMYAMSQSLLEEERLRLAALPRDSEAAQHAGLRLTLKRGKKHVSECRRMADETERFLAVARAPIGSLRDNVDIVMFFQGLPAVLRKYADFAEDLTERTRPTKEAVAQQNRILVSLVKYVTEITGQPRFSELAELILAWRETWPFAKDINSDVLRKQFRRAASSSDLLPLFTVKE